MRPATRQWLFLGFLAVSLAALVAVALWQMARARHKGPSGPGADPPAMTAPADPGPSPPHDSRD